MKYIQTYSKFKNNEKNTNEGIKKWVLATMIGTSLLGAAHFFTSNEPKKTTPTTVNVDRWTTTSDEKITDIITQMLTDGVLVNYDQHGHFWIKHGEWKGTDDELKTMCEIFADFNKINGHENFCQVYDSKTNKRLATITHTYGYRDTRKEKD